jgi:hypothetical protein
MRGEIGTAGFNSCGCRFESSRQSQ